jgi:hypothetical protein
MTQQTFDVLNLLYNTMPTMKFTLGEEKESKISFLDITISKEKNNFLFNVYIKPTTTDTIILSDSCHPQEHKLATVRYPIEWKRIT